MILLLTDGNTMNQKLITLIYFASLVLFHMKSFKCLVKNKTIFLFLLETRNVKH